MPPSDRLGAAQALTGVDTDRVFRALAGASPAVLHGIRVAAAVCLALWIAFYLQLSAPFWAGTSAALVCQPVLGAARRKGGARLVGTVVGTVFIVLLAACFPQSRAGFLLGLAVWCAACGFVSTLLDNFASYGAALAGYTAVIVAADASSSPDQIFTLALSRASEISIGIVCATVVMTATSGVYAPARLAGLLGGIVAETTARMMSTLRLAGPDAVDTRPERRKLIKRTIALGQPIDEAIGESSDLRYRRPVLQAAREGMYEVLSDWRTVAGHLRRLPDGEAQREATRIVQALPADLYELLASQDQAAWAADPAAARDACDAAARGLVRLETTEPSLRLLADRLAEALRGVARAANGLTLLTDRDAARPMAGRGTASGGMDLLPVLLNAFRIFVTIGAVEVFWIITAWPSGLAALTFATINVILLSPKNEQADIAAASLALGSVVCAALAGIAQFTLLPVQQTFLGLSLVLSLFLVPLNALATVPRLAPVFTPMAMNMLPFIAPANMMSYDETCARMA